MEEIVGWKPMRTKKLGSYVFKKSGAKLDLLVQQECDIQVKTLFRFKVCATLFRNDPILCALQRVGACSYLHKHT